MKENQKKAFDFAAETTKQLITISTAIITLTVTFSKDIIGNEEHAPKALLILTWLVFILSIISGVVTLMALTGTLQPMKKRQNSNSSNSNSTASPTTAPIPFQKDDSSKININNGNIRLFSIFQVAFFLSAIIMTGIFGCESLYNKSSIVKNANTYQVIRNSTLNGDTSTKYTDTLYLLK